MTDKYVYQLIFEFDNYVTDLLLPPEDVGIFSTLQAAKSHVERQFETQEWSTYSRDGRLAEYCQPDDSGRYIVVPRKLR